MLSEITSALTSIKAANDILRGFNSLKLETAVKEKSTELLNIIISLQSNIVTMQSDYNQLLTEKNEIEKELAKLKNIILDRDKYSLVEIASGIFAYTPKEKSKANETDYYLCQNCFDTKNIKSVLQKKYVEHKDLICNSCKSTFRLADDENSSQIRFTP